MTRLTRRSALKAAGASLAAATVPATVSAAESDWTVVETPVDSTIHDIAYTATNPHAVAGSGLVIERTAGGWEVVLQGGPTGNGNDLYGVDTTDDGERLWLVGSSGAIGEYDVTTGNLVDRSAPNDFTANFNDIAVTGPAGEADVYVADDSGSVHYSFDNGKEGTWNYEVPGSGSGLKAIEFYDARSGHVIDTNGKVFATDDGVTWNPIGIEDAGVTYYGLDSDAADDVRVSGGNASVFTYNGSQWVPESLGDAALFDIETDAGTGYTVGSGGAVFELEDGEWTRNETPVGENLQAVATGPVDIAVGSSGALLER
ncbi:WD40/YVTN/BNR-like repeat-containing protein [Natrinema sp. LN54]|uniref:WD40/YVTN/BNR-like repeat-containing protein n=1 Tax=Natrinema sp. LN54 TaxID=3458705 RepID=UPI0040368ECB